MTRPPIKLFNTVGACVPADHYILPVLPRQPEVYAMIEEKNYFILHAPRQSGKTTFLDFLTDDINSEDNFYAINCSLASLRGIIDDDKATIRIVSQINQAMVDSQIKLINKKAYTYDLLSGMKDPNRRIRTIIRALCQDLDKDLIFFFDAADCLSEQPLITFLSQIRDAYLIRHKPGNKFPRSMALVGMRDISDYLTQVRPESNSTGEASPFNIKKEALTLANFTQDEIGILYQQHTEASVVEGKFVHFYETNRFF